jgi:hypothetical protein
MITDLINGDTSSAQAIIQKVISADFISFWMQGVSLNRADSLLEAGQACMLIQ